jgi:hypothetical protein
MHCVQRYEDQAAETRAQSNVTFQRNNKMNVRLYLLHSRLVPRRGHLTSHDREAQGT